MMMIMMMMMMMMMIEMLINSMDIENIKSCYHDGKEKIMSIV
jgi:hypothetical protein